MDFLTALKMTLVGVLICLVWKGFPRFVDNLRHARMVLCAIPMRLADQSDGFRACVPATELTPPVLDVSTPAARRFSLGSYWRRHDHDFNGDAKLVSSNIIANEIVDALQYCADPYCFVPINSRH
jgi:hypothetical protein